jgi:hypothetical protein
MKRIVLVGFSIVLLLPLALQAQEKVSGTFATSGLTLDTLVLSEDRVVTITPCILARAGLKLLRS